MSLITTSILRRVACLSLLAIALQAHAVEILHWDRKPLPIDLPVGTERVIVLDRNVRVGLPQAIADPNVLRVQSAGGAIYLKANDAFDTQRVRIQDVETNQVVLFDVTAMASGANTEKMKVVIPDVGESSDGADQPDATAEKADEPAPVGTPVPVVMTRFAAQSLYAPVRTIQPIPGLNRVAMRLPDSLPSLLPSLAVSAVPVAAWTLDSWTVTAVKLTNRDARRSFELDPRWLQGDLHSAVFMHPTLGNRGSVEDTTTVFIVTSGQSLAQALPLSQEGDS